MPIKFLGQNTVVTFQDYLNAGALLIGTCTRTVEIERIRETVEVTTLEGEEVGHVLGLKRGRISLNALSTFNEDGEAVANDEQFRQWFEGGALLYVQVADLKDGLERMIDFYAYIESYRIVRNNNEGANFDVNLLWTQPSAYDVPLLACPTVTIIRSIDSILLEFNGVEGTTYNFDMVSPATSIVVTEPPFEALFAGLTAGTNYTIGVSVEQYGLEPLTCSEIATSTLSATMGVGYGGATIEDACGEGYASVFYYTGVFGVGSLIFEDEALTVPFNDFNFIKFNGVVYGVTAGEITSNEGACILVELVEVENNLSSATIDNITLDGVAFIDVLTGNFPISVTERMTGNHSGFEGNIVLTIYGIFSSGTASLTINGVFVECINLLGASGTYAFYSQIVTATDSIFITLNEGSCA